MPLLRAEADLLSQDDLTAGVIEEVITKDGLFGLLPFTKTEGKAYVYNREDPAKDGSAGVAFIDPNEAVTESSARVVSITTHLRILAGDVDVDKFIMETMGDKNSQVAIQIAAKAKAVGRAFKSCVINGDNGVDGKTFDGINQMCIDSANEVSAGTNGNALTYDMLDELLDAILLGADAIMMRSGTLRALKTLWRTAGGNTGGMIQIDNFGLSLPGHDGVPIIVNDWIPGDVAQGTEAATCSIYAMRLNEADGLHGIYGGESAGMRVEEIGTVQAKDAYRYRIKWYAGLALKASHSLGAIRGITDV